MAICIRLMRVPEDYREVAQVLSKWSSDPVSPEVLAEEDRKIPDPGKLWEEQGKLGGHDRKRWVAVDEEDGRIAGYGAVSRAPWTEPGDLWHTVIVRPEYRKQGVGRNLYACIEEWALEVGASQLLQSVKEDDPESKAFAERRGFEADRKTFESKLDLGSYSRPGLEAIVESVENSGIRLFSLADEPGEESERKLYALYRETHPDIPGYTGSFPDFKRWREWTLEGVGVSHDALLIAADGERYIGLVHLLWNAESESMYHEYTCTDREYRGRRIALALKIRGIEFSKKRGARYLRTHNDSMNAPMLGINRDVLGFEPEPGLWRMVKKLDGLSAKNPSARVD